MSQKRSNAARDAAPFDSKSLVSLTVLGGMGEGEWALASPTRRRVERAARGRSSSGVVARKASAFPDKDYLELSRSIRRRRAYRFAKRAFDIVFSAAVIAALAVPCAVLALVIWVDDPHGSPLFLQKRVGKDGRIFTMLKFRSMRKGAEEELVSIWHANEKSGPVFKMKGDPRITRVGRLIRKASIDELPQFVNVLLGDMSVVGPRPALPIEVAQYTARDRLRLVMKPGITCFWQTRPNRDDIGFDEWVEMDLRYIRTCSMRSDLALIIRTVGVVFTAQGA